jgi:N-methylhydantoinase A
MSETTTPRREGLLVGVDVGGTFTDLLAYDTASGRLLSAKVPSIPGAQWQGVVEALGQLGIAPSSVSDVVHGTTISTNALLERKGARTGLITTAGFRDVIEVGKGRRLVGGLFDIGWQRPQPLVPRDRRHEIRERVGAAGEVVESLDEGALTRILGQMQAQGVESVAVALINAYVNPAHEEAVARVLGELAPELPVSRSAHLSAERGEFERGATCVLNAYLTPVLRRYLASLRDALDGARVHANVSIMGSNGGTMSLAAAAERAAATFLSGPVGGVVGAVQVAAAAGTDDIITFDMGGTSTDVALVHALTPRMSHDNQVDAYPLKMPQLDIHTIGAGGGSVVYVQADGTLAVGPESAGAVPGPACYGRGGERATVSDANLVLGRLPTRRALSGGLVLDRDAAVRALERVREELATDTASSDTAVEVLADAALRIAVSRMAGAVREVSVHRGHDPRAFALFGFGGAGPMHVFLVAEELDITEVLIPPLPGHLSALGQMAADCRRDLVEAWGGAVSTLHREELAQRIEALCQRGRTQLADEGIAPGRARFVTSLDMRYAGQSFTLQTPFDVGHGGVAAAGLDAARSRFDALHEQNFGYCNPQLEVEVVNLRLVALGEVDKPAIARAPAPQNPPPPQPREVWFDGWCSADVWSRDHLPRNTVLNGPLVVEEPGGTTVVPPRWTVRVLPCGTLRCHHND